MATAKPHRTYRAGHPGGPDRRIWRNALGAVVVLGGLVLALFWHTVQSRAVLATAYGARIACTCHYVAGRPLKDCARDFEPGMALVLLSDNAAAHSITARVPLVASQVASFRDGAGCLLQAWRP